MLSTSSANENTTRRAVFGSHHLHERRRKLLAASDAVWRPLCEALWADKVYVPARFRDVRAMSRRKAYWASMLDAKRTAITGPPTSCARSNGAIA